MAIAVIINPVSGGRKGSAGHRVELARRVAAGAGEQVDVFVTECRGHAAQLARTARDLGVRLVVAWGGDGTVNEVASALASSPVALGVVPSGSGNGLAHALKIPNDPAAALRVAMSGTPRPIDMGEINGRLFANIAGIGFDAAVASRFNDPANVKRGLAGYVRIVARTLMTYEPLRYTITAEGAAEHQARAVLVSFANGTEYGNGMRIAPDARIDDGLLNMVVVEERSRVRTVLQLHHLLRGTIGQSPDCTLRTVTEASITADTPLTFHVDGEPVEGGSTAHVRVLPGVLSVAV